VRARAANSSSNASMRRSSSRHSTRMSSTKALVRGLPVCVAPGER
jgi:hypothetical protein